MYEFHKKQLNVTKKYLTENIVLADNSTNTQVWNKQITTKLRLICKN